MRFAISLRAAAALVALLAACSEDSQPGVLGVDATVDARADVVTAYDTGPEDARRGCGLVTCESAGANCGPIGDGCGAILNCGTCAAPQTCGGGGVPSRCGGTSGCVPRTCAMAGANCGPVSDGCGGLLECGSCPVGQSCGGRCYSDCLPEVLAVYICTLLAIVCCV